MKTAGLGTQAEQLAGLENRLEQVDGQLKRVSADLISSQDKLDSIAGSLREGLDERQVETLTTRVQLDKSSRLDDIGTPGNLALQFSFPFAQHVPGDVIHVQVMPGPQPQDGDVGLYYLKGRVVENAIEVHVFPADQEKLVAFLNEGKSLLADVIITLGSPKAE